MTQILIWGAIMALIYLVRPDSGIVPYAAVTLAYVIGSVVERLGNGPARDYALEAAHWKAQMDALQPIVDVDDDGHLFEWLDPPEWNAVFAELAKMPPESRSLKSAIGVVSPESL